MWRDNWGLLVLIIQTALTNTILASQSVLHLNELKILAALLLLNGKRWAILICNDNAVMLLSNWLNHLWLYYVSRWIELVLALRYPSHKSVSILRAILELLGYIIWLFARLIIFSMDLLGKIFLWHLWIIIIFLSGRRSKLILLSWYVSCFPIALLSDLGCILLSFHGFLIKFGVTW